MKRLVFDLAILGTLLCFAGCNKYQPPATAAPRASASPTTAAPAVPAGPAPAANAPPAAAPATAAPSAPGSVAQPPIVHLSADVALPQTLPDGTAMGFSVDYAVTGAQAGSLSQSAWVVERAHGSAARFPVALKQKDNLSTFVQGWRPEEGPFTMYIVDGSGRKISNTVSMPATGQ